MNQRVSLVRLRKPQQAVRKKEKCGSERTVEAEIKSDFPLYCETKLDSTYDCAYNKTMKITWDSKKAATNPKNHEGVTFEEARHVLLDPYALSREDSDSEDEQRFVTLGMGSKGRILMIVYTYREETMRLISAWKANEPQRRRYENQF